MIFEVKEYSFSYQSEKEEYPVLHQISFQIQAGEFLLLCGPSGCGKTTLLRCMKEQIAPHGKSEGEITRCKASDIGFVFQNPENQIVTDTVRHELAFGLENMGLPTEVIRQRVAETALFFGIDEWIDRSVYEISGGEKQLLNLAAVIAMRPKLLLLDEPTSQLDPVARKNFIELLTRVNRELGIAILISEHHLEEMLPVSDRVLYIEAGKQAFLGDKVHFLEFVRANNNQYEKTLPAASYCWNLFQKECPSASCPEREGMAAPFTVREGREWLQGEKECVEGYAEIVNADEGEKSVCLRADHIWFQYHRNEPFVLKGLELAVCKGEIHMVLGGNGSGKTTLLSILSKRCYANRGKIRLGKERKMPVIGLLPQNPKAMFTKDSVLEELQEVYSAAEQESLLTAWHLRGKETKHPYDLSGGEQQRLALALVLAGKPELLLLDEPTKGLDPLLKEELGDFLKEYTKAGNTVVAVTHDAEFAACYGDVCSLLFEGEILTTKKSREFFLENAFFTTDAVRLTRNIVSGILLKKDIKLCKVHINERQ